MEYTNFVLQRALREGHGGLLQNKPWVKRHRCKAVEGECDIKRLSEALQDEIKQLI